MPSIKHTRKKRTSVLQNTMYDTRYDKYGLYSHWRSTQKNKYVVGGAGNALNYATSHTKNTLKSIFTRKIKVINGEKTDIEPITLIKIVNKYVPEDDTKLKAVLNLMWVNYVRGNDASKQRNVLFEDSGNDTKIRDFETIIIEGLHGDDKDKKNYNTRLKGEIAYRVYSYFVATLSKIHYEIENNKTSATKMDSKVLEETMENMKYLQEWIRRIELLRKPMWAQSLVDTIQQMFNEGYSRKEQLEDYYDNLNPTGKEGVRVWMDVYKDYSNDNAINNNQCDVDKDNTKFYYRARVEALDNNTHKQVNNMLNQLFYQNEIMEQNPNGYGVIASYKNDMVKMP